MIQNGSRADDLDYPDEEFCYYVCAERFGWTPQQVDEQPAYMLEWLVNIAGAMEEIKQEKSNPNVRNRRND